MNTVYNASAGTGKTFQVTRLYEKLVLEDGVTDFTVSADINIADLDASGQVGALGVAVVNGSANLDVTTAIDLFDPFLDGRISDADLDNFLSSVMLIVF